MMKKLLLLALTGVAALQGFAQTNSVVFLQDKLTARTLEEEHSERPASLMSRNASASKSTTTGGSSWFNYTDIVTSTSSKFYYNIMHQDSSIQYTGSQGPTHVWEHGFGRSFDPTDSVYHAEVETYVGLQQHPEYRPPFRVTFADGYTVDSIGFLSRYMRHDPVTTVVDTMYIYIAKIQRKSSVTGVYASESSTTSTVSGDGHRRFADMLYDPATNLISDSALPNVQVIKRAMDAAYAADTSTNGWSNWTSNGIALTTPITCSPSEVIVTYVAFKGKTYSLNTPETSSNTMRFYAYDVAGQNAEPRQAGYSYETGLVMTNQNRYPTPTNAWTLNGHLVLLPGIFYQSDGFNTNFSFHVTCNTCVDLKVANVSNILGASAYPNPASTEINVPFSLKNAADVKVSLTNAIGQVMATKSAGNSTNGKVVFNTAELANGIYFYTVEANGEHKTGRVVVAH
jgi:hypothetical protein